MKKSKKIELLLMTVTTMLFISLCIIGYMFYKQNSPQPLLTSDRTEFEVVACEPPKANDLFENLQNQIQAIDATHLIRKYHKYLALFDVKKLLKSHVVVDMKQKQKDESFINRASSQFDAPEFAWERIDNAKPLDEMRLTFRGNGVPENAEKLAKSELIEPKLQAFYKELTQPNVTLWKSPRTVDFPVRTHDGKSYLASSTPFISIRPISKTQYANMKSAALPFLWDAYAAQEREDETTPDNQDIDSISGGITDSDTIQSLYFREILKNTEDPEEVEELKTAITGQYKSLKKFFNPQSEQSYLKSLSQHDPEFSSLFLINNLFEQYNLFSVFKDGISLKINAIDTKLNITYISYNINFDMSDELSDNTINDTNDLFDISCNGKDVNISDEFFLIITETQAYLMRAYLPDCYLTPDEYRNIDKFINTIRILNDANLSAWRK